MNSLVSMSLRGIVRRRTFPTFGKVCLFSTYGPQLSYIGSAPISIPSGVEILIEPRNLDEITRIRMDQSKFRRGKPQVNLTQVVRVKGPRGELALDVADFIQVKVEGTSDSGVSPKAVVSVPDEKNESQKKMWGTTRSLINNSVIGVSEGHVSIIKLLGTGYRASFDKDPIRGTDVISLKVGYSIPRIVPVPEGINVSIPLPHRIILEGNDKQQVKLFAGSIRSHRPPEPYKGKGVYVDNETIKLKAHKIK